jgi:hypothetical protein
MDSNREFRGPASPAAPRAPRRPAAAAGQPRPLWSVSATDCG